MNINSSGHFQRPSKQNSRRNSVRLVRRILKIFHSLQKNNLRFKQLLEERGRGSLPQKDKYYNSEFAYNSTHLSLSWSLQRDQDEEEEEEVGNIKEVSIHKQPQNILKVNHNFSVTNLRLSETQCRAEHKSINHVRQRKLLHAFTHSPG